MGSDLDWRAVYHGFVVYHDHDRVRQVFQTLSLYGYCAGPALGLCGRAVTEYRQELYQELCCRLLGGAIIVLACIIFSLFASSPPVVDPNAAAVTQVWSYVGELIFNMLVLVGAVKMADRVVREMMGL